jgi:hypothetical protein
VDRTDAEEQPALKQGMVEGMAKRGDDGQRTERLIVLRRRYEGDASPMKIIPIFSMLL